MKSKGKFTIREAEERDIPVLVDFMAKLALHVSGGEPKTLTVEARQRLEKFLKTYIDETEKCMVVSCTARGKVVGMGNIHIWHSPNLWEEAAGLDLKSAFIDDLWVEPEYRQRGLFAMMLDVLVSFAERHHIEELYLEYSVSNAEAESVWRKLGFNPTGIRAAAFTGVVREKLVKR